MALWTSPIFAVLAIGLGGIRTGYSLRTVLLWGITGLAVGAMMVPDIEPESTRSPALWQMSCGAIGGALMAVALEGGALAIFVSALVGLVLGFLSPYWLKHFNF